MVIALQVPCPPSQHGTCKCGLQDRLMNFHIERLIKRVLEKAQLSIPSNFLQGPPFISPKALPMCSNKPVGTRNRNKVWSLPVQFHLPCPLWRLLEQGTERWRDRLERRGRCLLAPFHTVVWTGQPQRLNLPVGEHPLWAWSKGRGWGDFSWQLTTLIKISWFYWPILFQLRRRWNHIELTFLKMKNSPITAVLQGSI